MLPVHVLYYESRPGYGVALCQQSAMAVGVLAFIMSLWLEENAVPGEGHNVLAKIRTWHRG